MARTSKAKDQPASQRQIELCKIDDLTLDPENARKHGDSDLQAIARSLDQFGQQSPIVITQDGLVIKGNGTLMAAMKLGWSEIECLRTSLDEIRPMSPGGYRNSLVFYPLKAFYDEARRQA